MTDEPELYIFDPSSLPGAAEFRAERERGRAEGRSRYRAVVAETLAPSGGDDAGVTTEAVFAALFDHHHDDGSACHCSCHPRLPESDFHDYGFACSCQLTPEERQASWREWRDGMDAYWESSEGQAVTAAREAEQAELAVWLEDNPSVLVTSHGGWAPEQWRGEVDGHSFYFRERHGAWRIELDLRPSGRMVTVWKGGDLDDADSTELRETDEGDIIAEGTTTDSGYGSTPVERAHFITGIIRDHIRREICPLHTIERADLDRRLGTPALWCPVCGARLD